jgi:hypothetical protein
MKNIRNKGYLGKRGKTVGSATGITDNMLIRFIKLVVDSINVSRGVILCRSTQNNSLSTLK